MLMTSRSLPLRDIGGTEPVKCGGTICRAARVCVLPAIAAPFVKLLLVLAWFGSGGRRNWEDELAGASSPR